jgi:hypothetical protein
MNVHLLKIVFELSLRGIGNINRLPRIFKLNGLYTVVSYISGRSGLFPYIVLSESQRGSFRIAVLVGLYLGNNSTRFGDDLSVGTENVRSRSYLEYRASRSFSSKTGVYIV